METSERLEKLSEIEVNPVQLEISWIIGQHSLATSALIITPTDARQ